MGPTADAPGAATTAEVVVRPAGPADAAALARLCDELNDQEGEPVGHWTPEAIRRDGFGPAPEFRVVLALIGGEPVGYAAYHPSYSTEWGQRGLYLQDLYVVEPARGRGAGRALLAAVARAAAAEGRTFVWWCAKPENRRALAFYAGLGAVREDVCAHALYGEPFAALTDAAAAPSGPASPAAAGGG